MLSFLLGVLTFVTVVCCGAILVAIVMGLWSTGGNWNAAAAVPYRPDSDYVETPEQRAERMRAYRKEQRRLYRRRRSAAFRWYNRTPRDFTPSKEFLEKIEVDDGPVQ
jgi:hypothetical protein